MAHYSLTENKCFIHVPKTAGVSITTVVYNNIVDITQVQKVRDKNNLPRNGWSDNHYTYEQVIETFDTLDIPHKKDMVFFGLIRNPWDRMVSLYKHRLRKQKYNTPEDSALLAQGFEPWLLNTQHRADKYLTKLPQLKWFEGCPNKKLLKFEELNDKTISSLIGHEVKLPRQNVGSNHNEYDSFHTETTRDFIANHFAEDIAWGDYK